MEGLKYTGVFDEQGDKILIITEVIQSGETLSVLLETLATLGYTCDVATMGIEGLDEVYNIEIIPTSTVSKLVLDNGKFRKKYAWKPNYSLESGLTQIMASVGLIS